MSNSKGESAGESDVSYRRRGRPAGRNRVPLSREERRARNAQYEKERRNETAEAMAQLADAANCDPNITNADLLATVISRIQRAHRQRPSEDILHLGRINEKLKFQIATLQSRLETNDVNFRQLDMEHNDQPITAQSSAIKTIVPTSSCDHEDQHLRKQSKERRRSRKFSSEPDQRHETQSRTWSGSDSGIDLRCHMISPPDLRVEDNTQNSINTEPQPTSVLTEAQTQNVSQEYVKLQTELYNQICNSESKFSEQPVSEWNIETLPKKTVSVMEILTRSLMKIPSIKPPKSELHDLCIGNKAKAGPQQTKQLPYVDSPCELINVENKCDHVQDLPTLDILTDNEKRLLINWMDEEFPETNTLSDAIQKQNLE